MSERLILVGGGLANGLIAARVRMLRPDVEVTLLERDARLGGRHVWCFHDADLTRDQHDWMAPFVVRSWATHDVRFKNRHRRLRTGYHAITSERLHEVLTSSLGAGVRTGCTVADVAPDHVRLVDGTRIPGEAIVDGRGDPGVASLDVAYQKFLGRWLELEQDHELDAPLLMDAGVEQQDGYRFVYVLPFGPRELLLEDTYYADGPELDVDVLRSRIDAYARSRNWRVARVHHEERGVLPITLGGDVAGFWSERARGVPCSGMRAALFHSTTGYSLPEAVRLADALALLPRLSSAAADAVVRARSAALWRDGAFYRFLNRMLFRAAEPSRRHRVLERFYGLPEPLIARFYAGRTTLADRVRILSGRPPVPIGRALACLFDAGRSRPTSPAGSARSAAVGPLRG